MRVKEWFRAVAVIIVIAMAVTAVAAGRRRSVVDPGTVYLPPPGPVGPDLLNVFLPTVGQVLYAPIMEGWKTEPVTLRLVAEPFIPVDNLEWRALHPRLDGNTLVIPVWRSRAHADGNTTNCQTQTLYLPAAGNASATYLLDFSDYGETDAFMIELFQGYRAYITVGEREIGWIGNPYSLAPLIQIPSTKCRR